MNRQTSPGVIAEALERRQLLSRVTFAPPVNYPTGSFPGSVATADLNGDGNQDLIVADYGSGQISVLLGNGDGTFSPHTDYPVGNGPVSIAIADMNGDGHLDILVANTGGNGSDPNPDKNTISLLLGNGDGTFQPKIDIPAGNLPNSIAVADFNGDGKPDIVVANRLDNAVGIILGNGDGTFAPQVEYPSGINPESVAVGDFNVDGHPDVVTANRAGGGIVILLGNGDGTLRKHVGIFSGTNPHDVAVADINGDGLPDIITSSFNTNTINVLINQGGNAQFNDGALYTAPGFPFALAIADMNLDGRPDVVTAGQRNRNVSVLLRLSDNTLQESIDFKVGIAPTGVAVADFNHDGKPDVVDTNFNDDTVSVLLSTLIPTTTTLAINQTTVPVGGKVQFTATVTTAGRVPRGNVLFFDGLKQLRAVPLQPDGTATLVFGNLALGAHAIHAQYVGQLIPPDDLLALGGSVSTTQIVNVIAFDLSQPAIVPILNLVSLNPVFASGDLAAARVILENQSTAGINGTVGVQFFASTDQTLDAGDIALTGIFQERVRLQRHSSKTITLKFPIQPGVPSGTYFILAALTPIAGLLPTQVSPVAGFTVKTFSAA